MFLGLLQEANGRKSFHSFIVLHELAHQGIVQKQKCIAHCFTEVTTASKSIFDTIEQLEEFHQSRLPLQRKLSML